jgi:hypothetical protein
MPVTGEENIFGALFKWGDVRSKEEDFYSKSLVLILKRLKLYDMKLAASFLRSLFGCTEFDLGSSDWDIIDHTGDENRPDIIFESADTLTYIEVKVSKEPDKGQLISYHDDLNKKGKGRKTALFLLTRLGLDEDWGIPNQPQVSWVKIWGYLLETERKLKLEQRGTDVAPLVYFLVRDFRQFLEEEGMGVEHVSKMVSPDSLHDLRKFLSIIRAGCRMAKLGGSEPGLEEGTEEGWVGWWFKEGRKKKVYWCGFYLDNPTRVGFGLGDPVYRRLKNRMKRKPNLEPILKERFHWEDHGDKEKCGEFFFNLLENFTDLGAEEQLKFVCESVNGILKDAIGRKIATK